MTIHMKHQESGIERVARLTAEAAVAEFKSVCEEDGMRLPMPIARAVWNFIRQTIIDSAPRNSAALERIATMSDDDVRRGALDWLDLRREIAAMRAS